VAKYNFGIVGQLGLVFHMTIWIKCYWYHIKNSSDREMSQVRDNGCGDMVPKD